MTQIKWTQYSAFIIYLLFLSGLTFSAEYPEIYPFVPYEVEKIYSTVENISEDKDFIKNFDQINKLGLKKAKTNVKPWTSTYWPLNKGLIADPYESTFLGYYVERGTISWTNNYNIYLNRKKFILDHINDLNESQLATLAPSEKYDLLLGDRTFDLTARLWDYMQKWGNDKEHGFLSNVFLIGKDALVMAEEMVHNGWFESIDDAFQNAYQLRGSLAVDYALELVKSGKFQNIEDAMPEAIELAIENSNNYVLEKKNSLIAFWEGICHGWATAAGIYPRPRKTVEFELPDGRKLKFYPTDIKALISLLWANSLIQDNKNIDKMSGENIGGGVISAGLRCNLDSRKKDEWGRYYDHRADPFNNDHSPRCVGVHPAIWHLGLINIIGKQGRSFIVERKVDAEVDNHPMYKYEMIYFNPITGKKNNNAQKNIVPIGDSDDFKDFRSRDAKYIVGVNLKMTYIDWARPKRYLTDNESMDEDVTKTMMYDLELNDQLDIVGGQWRARKSKRTSSNDRNLNHNQPDFFWVITKEWKSFFKEIPDLEKWTDLSKAPPKSWLAHAIDNHKFIYNKKFSYGNGQKCRMINSTTNELIEVSCEYEEPRPQPLINVINTLVKLSEK